MSGLYKHKFQLTSGQKNKLRIAYKKQKHAVIGFKKDQLLTNGDDEILLTQQQHRAVNKAIEKKTGVRLIIDYTQLLKNKEGGLLKEILELAENNVPYVKRYVSPAIRENIAPLLKEHFLPWLHHLIDNELDSIITKSPSGAGLKRRIRHKLDELMKDKKN